MWKKQLISETFLFSQLISIMQPVGQGTEGYQKWQKDKHCKMQKNTATEIRQIHFPFNHLHLSIIARFQEQ